MLRTSKLKRYQSSLVKQKSVRSSKRVDAREEKHLLELMAALWEGMSVEEREQFRDTNHLSWPAPRDEEE